MSESSLKTLPTRSEIPEELTWDLSLVYLNNEFWEKDFSQVEKQVPRVAALEQTLTKTSDKLLEGLQLRDETFKLYLQVRAYAHLQQSEDNGNSGAQSRSDRADMLGTKLMAAAAFIEPAILQLEPETLASWIDEEDGLELYRYYLSTLERRRPHVREKDVEDVLALAREPLGGSRNVFKFFNNADIRFPEITGEDGETAELTKGNYQHYLRSGDRAVREDAFRKMHGEYANWRNTLAASLAGSVKANIFNARVRRYDSALQAALSPDDIPEAVYHNLISATRERLPVLHRYLRLRKKLLKLDHLQMWDLYVPMVDEVQRKFSYPEAQETVLAAAQPMGEKYFGITQRSFDERWIDVPENKGKTSGAFSGGAYTTPPYMLLNWQDKLNDVFTLAHELGHSIHSQLTHENQPFVYGDYTIFVAEVASTLYEALLTNHLVEQAKADGDRKLQLYLLNETAERFRTTLYRQTMFAEFELQIHQSIENGESLTADAMSEKYFGLNQDYYGAEVTVDEAARTEWARIPHLYYGFYVYQYATGISASAALSKQILEEGQPAVDRYLKFLQGGSSDTSINLLKLAGVDMTEPQPVHQALDVFDEVIGEMEELAEN